jgi:protein subunit release factor A
MRKKIIQITKKDFEIQTFRSGGPGGQHQNKTDSGVRLIHKDSGARGESRNHKSQLMNKKLALKRLSETVEFKLWVNRRVNEIETGLTIEEQVEKSMSPENIRIETKEKGKWTITNNL